MCPQESAQRKLQQLGFSSKELFCILKELGFYLDDITANDTQWIFRHEDKIAKSGQDFISLPRYNMYNKKLSLIIVDQVCRFGFSKTDILKAAKRAFKKS
jgi:hypothetical protein